MTERIKGDRFQKFRVDPPKESRPKQRKLRRRALYRDRTASPGQRQVQKAEIPLADDSARTPTRTSSAFDRGNHISENGTTVPSLGLDNENLYLRGMCNLPFPNISLFTRSSLHDVG